MFYNPKYRISAEFITREEVGYLNNQLIGIGIGERGGTHVFIF